MIRKIAEGAYFVPSYSEQTITSRDELMTSQTIAIDENIEIDEHDVLEADTEPDETQQHPQPKSLLSNAPRAFPDSFHSSPVDLS